MPLSEWKETILGDVVYINPLRSIKKGSLAKKIPMDVLNTNDRSINSLESIEFTGSGTKFRNGDTLLARITPCLENGKTAYVDCLDENEIAFGSTEYIVMTGKDGITDNLFVYYLAREPQFRSYAIGHMEGSSGRQRVPAIAVSKYPINLPPLPEQRSIANILGSIDDKIELNRQLNKTLEDMAQAIFKSWFVDFEPVKAKAEGRTIEGLSKEILDLFPHSFEDSELGEIPKGWDVGSIKDLCFVKGGYAYKSQDFQCSGYPVIKIKNIKENKTIDVNDVQYIPDKIALRTKDFWLADGDLIMAMTGATVGKFGLIVNNHKNPCLLNQRVAKFFPKENNSKLWVVYCYLNKDEILNEIVNTAYGSAQPNISADLIMSTKVILPNADLIKVFNNTVNPIFKKILQGIKETEALSKLRDSLLPKLITGEIRVFEARKFLGDSL